MTAIVQYIPYVASGYFLLLMIIPVITYGAGVRIWGLPLVFFPFLLGGYVSGLSFLFPRAAAMIGTVIGSAYLVAGVAELYRQQPAFTSQPLNLIVPAVILLMVSLFAWREDEEPLWQRAGTAGRIAIGMSASIPALIATLSLLSIVQLVIVPILRLFVGG
jgi:hypothetical protein